MGKINICGLNFDNVTMSEAVEFLSQVLNNNGKAAVVTPNAEITARAMEDREFCILLNKAELIVPDGIGVLHAGEILKTPLKEKVAGVELGENLIAYAAKNSFSVYFLGGKPGVAEAAAEKLKEKYSGLSVAGCHDGYFNRENTENDTVVSDINRSGAKILFVCMGAYVQEKWIFDNRDNLPTVNVCLGLGGSLDVYAGNVKRAPKIFIRLGLEWLWRVIREPWRFARIWELRRFYGKVKRYKNV